MLIVITFLVASTVAQHFGEEAIYIVNSKKALHSVNDKFLSFSIDPAILLTGLNLSDTTVTLAKHLSPAYIRLAGPSTRFVKYEAEERWDTNSGVVLTPPMWFGINEWLIAANLTPVFGINDRETTNGEWNPHSTIPLFDMSDTFNLSCYWQLGYDCSNKTESQYIADLRRLRHVLEAYPDKKNTWKIVGSDLSKCMDHPESTRRVLEDLEDVLEAVVWEPTTTSESLFLEEHLPGRLHSFPFKPGVSIWLVAPKSAHPVSFSTAISWAKQIGEAAKVGYDVIFRQPRLHEIFSETPPFWVSLFHKILMGRTVLDVKTLQEQNSQVSVYAHCTRHQNNFIRSGAMTIFTINNSTQNHTILIRFGTVSLKNTDVQTYVLTAPNDDATDVYLNDEKLSLKHFSGDRMNLLPKSRRTKIVNYLSLTLPEKSVSFFVLPAARVPVCIHDEEDVREVMEEINEDQKIPFSEEISVEVTPRFYQHKSPSLHELQRQMEKEIESDEKYYKQTKIKKDKQKKITLEDVEGRNYLLERAKMNEKQRKQLDEGRRPLLREKHREDEPPKRIFELELTSAEIRKVLSERAKAKAAKKRIIFTSEELEEIMDKATEKFLKDKNTSIRIRKKAKREAGRDRKDINMRLLKLKTLGEKRRLVMKQLGERLKNSHHQKRERRDINMDLLRLKTELLQNKNKKVAPVRRRFENNEQKEATIREPGETSADFEQDYVEVKQSRVVDDDVFAQLADPDDYFFTTTTEKSKFGLKFKNRPLNLFSTHKPFLPKVDFVSKRPKVEIYRPREKIAIVDEGQHFDQDYEEDYLSVEENENFPCIHEFTGGNNKVNKSEKMVSELWEVAAGEKKDNNLPAVTNRGFPSVRDEFEAASQSNLERYFKEEKDVSLENDYEDLEGDDSDPVRLKRDVNPSGTDTLKDQQVKMLRRRLYLKKKRGLLEKSNAFNERYKSLTEGLKVWKPADILTLKESDKRRSKRSQDNYVSSVENEIDKFMSEIAKDEKMVEPKLEAENGDYQLVFPNKDKIEVVEKEGDTELKLVLHGETCPTTTEQGTTEGKQSYIQKISKKRDNNLWQKLLRKVTKFFQRLSVKLKNYVLEDIWK